MFDNLRRTLSAPAAFVALLAGWTLPLPAALAWTGFVLLTVALPTILPVIAALVPRHAAITTRSHFSALGVGYRATRRRRPPCSWPFCLTRPG